MYKKNCFHELREGEKWLGNHSCNKEGIFEFDEMDKHFKTIRFGKQAYDINGIPLDQKEHRPLIIHKSEYDEWNKQREEQFRKIRGYV